jgi:hypothetical protein
VLISYTTRRSLRRGVSSGRGRRQSKTNSKLRRPRKQLNARLKESAISKLATLKKLYSCPKEASGRPHSLNPLETSRNVVLPLPVVVLYLEARPGKLPQQPPAAATR